VAATPASAASADAEPPRRNLRHLRALIPYLRPYGLAIAGAGVALTIAAGAVLVIGMGLRALIDEGFRAGNTQLLDTALFGLGGLIVVLAIATYARFYLVSWLGERVVADIRRAVFDHVLKLSPDFYEATRVGEVMSRLTTDTTLLQTVVGSSMSVALRNLLLLMGGTAMLMITSARLTGLVFLIVPLVIVPIVLIGRQVRRLSRASQDRVADVGAYVEETLNAIRVVQAFGHEGRDRTRFAARVEDAFATAVRRIRARAALTAIVITFVFGAVAVILWMGGHAVIDGRMTPGDLSAFVFYAIVVAGSVGAISEVIGDLQRAAGAAERLVELLATQPTIRPPTTIVALPPRPFGRVRFSGVTFHYPSRPKQAALTDFSLDVRAGERVALVGPSGSGKSTVFQLLLRFYDPGQGTIEVDDLDIRRADPAAVRARIGLVPQDPVIFSADAWENIAYGRPDASKEDIRAAAETAAAAEFLDRQPQGFDTFMGEKGVRLSGGQRQRIAIARAVLRDPAILLLDEATSALDAESEKLVQDALDRLMAGRTTLIIAHRLATVLKADRIAVMDEGRVVCNDTHAQLLAHGCVYARLAAPPLDSAETPASAPAPPVPAQ